VIAIPVVVLPIVWFGRRLRAESRSSQDRIADIGAMVTEVLGARASQAFNQETRENDRLPPRWSAACAPRCAASHPLHHDQRDAAGDGGSLVPLMWKARRAWRAARCRADHRASC
jgi:ABC-type multidrug transport system fused ATPase/permease subunit